MQIWSKGHLLAHIDSFDERITLYVIFCIQDDSQDDSDFGWCDAEPECDFGREEAENLPDDFICAYRKTYACEGGALVFITTPELYEDSTLWNESDIARALDQGKVLLAKRDEAPQMTERIPSLEERKAAVLRILEKHLIPVVGMDIELGYPDGEDEGADEAAP